MESASKQKSSKEKNIQVFVRVRPLNSIERNAKSFSVVDCSSREVTVKERVNDKITKTFGFDRVFNPESKQVDVYKHVVNPLIDEVLSGYNCTVFAYGQTGTGKTFTMEGEKSNDPSVSWKDDPLSGIVPRAMNHLFDELRLLGDAEFTVRVSFLEIYNEELIDLLSPPDDMTKLRLFEDSARKGSVLIQGLEEKSVNNKDEVYKILEKGSMKRRTAATLMNAHSSRSHTIFTITIHIKDNALDGEELLRTGKLNLVDLAGSENIGRSGAQDKRAREAGNINQSLLTLGRCITALVEKTPHVPYRESKLTRMLQDSLGGRTKTSIIATISPALVNLEETLSTLDYAHRAKNITNRPEINQKMSKKALIREYTEEIEKLRKDLQATRDKNGVFLASENYNELISDAEHMRNELTTKINQIKTLTEQKENTEKIMEELNINLNKEIEEKKFEIIETKQKLLDSNYEKKELDYVIGKRVETEEELTQQATELKNVADETTYSIQKLQDTLDRKRAIEKLNTSNVTELFTKIDGLSNYFVHFCSQTNREIKNDLVEKVSSHNIHICQKEGTAIDNIQNQITCLDQLVDNIVTCTEQNLTRTKAENENLIQELLGNLKSKTEVHSKLCSKVVKTCNNITELILKSDLVKFEENQTNIEENMSLWKDKLIEMQSDCSMIEDALNHNKIETVHQIETIENLLKEVNEQAEDLDAFEIQEDEIIQSMYQSIIKLRDNKAGHKKSREVVRKGMDNVTQAFSSLKEGVDSRSVTLMTSLQDDTFKKTQSIISSISTAGEDITEKNTEAVSSIKENIEVVNKHFNGFVEESKNIFEEQKLTSEQQCDKLKTSIDTHVNELNQLTVDGIGTGVKGRSSVLRETLMTHQEEFNRERQQYLVDMKNSLNEDFSRIENILHKEHKCPNIIRSFAEQEYRPDVPSGETPPRKEFKYPNRFAATSPHERLLERFRLLVPRSQFSLEEGDSGLAQEETISGSEDNVTGSSNSQQKPRRSSSLNDLNDIGSEKQSISPAASEVVIKKSKKRAPKENKPIFKKVGSNGRIPIAKSNSGESVLRSNNRAILSEKN